MLRWQQIPFKKIHFVGLVFVFLFYNYDTTGALLRGPTGARRTTWPFNSCIAACVRGNASSRILLSFF